MRENFPPSLDFTLGFEGGYVNHPKDPGGHTNKGVTLATLRRFQPGATVADLKAISRDMLLRIYRAGYWDEVNADGLAAGVDLAAFDYAVNSGPAAARKSLLAVIGGPHHETVQKLCRRRLSIYRTFRHWKTFGKGWTRRIVACEALGVKWAMAAAKGTTPNVVKHRVEAEAEKADKMASRQQGAGGVAGAGGATSVPAGAENADLLATWALAGIVGAAIILAAWLFWRAYVNRARARAYREAAST